LRVESSKQSRSQSESLLAHLIEASQSISLPHSCTIKTSH
jgi:hypothetical protein